MAYRGGPVRGFGVGRPWAVLGVVVLVALVLAGIGSSSAVAAPTWSPVEAPIPPNAGSSTTPFGSSDPFNAVACPAAGSCVAVGSYVDTDGNYQGLIDTLSVGTWTMTEAPLPADAATTGQGASLYSLSCPAAGSCVAVGTYDNAQGSQGLIETLADGVWTPTTMPPRQTRSFRQNPTPLVAS